MYFIHPISVEVSLIPKKKLRESYDAMKNEIAHELGVTLGPDEPNKVKKTNNCLVRIQKK